jgi:lysophospholipase L1-like esterase
VSAPNLPDAVPVDHWYFLAGIDVRAPRDSGAVVILGDSITDGRGSTTNGNDRWPDVFARRLQASPATVHVAVLNAGIGGNRLLRDGLGPSALARFDRDVLAQSGVRWLIVLEGINDIGTASGARAKSEPAATADDIIGAYARIIERAHAHGIRVYGVTIMPFEGFSYASYFTPESEAERQTVNAWIRTSRRFDAVIDFDAVTRDPERPSRLSAAVDGGDHLHPSSAGYRIMGEAIDLGLFASPARYASRSGARTQGAPSSSRSRESSASISSMLGRLVSSGCGRARTSRYSATPIGLSMPDRAYSATSRFLWRQSNRPMVGLSSEALIWASTALR